MRAWPLEGTIEGFPTIRMIRTTTIAENTQPVRIELVMKSPNNGAARGDTPDPSPAANAEVAIAMRSGRKESFVTRGMETQSCC